MLAGDTHLMRLDWIYSVGDDLDAVPSAWVYFKVNCMYSASIFAAFPADFLTTPLAVMRSVSSKMVDRENARRWVELQSSEVLAADLTISSRIHRIALLHNIYSFISRVYIAIYLSAIFPDFLNITNISEQMSSREYWNLLYYDRNS